MRTAVAAPAPDPGWLLARLDRVPLGGFHRRLLLVSGLGWMFDAMDILMLGSVVAAIGREWGLDATTGLWITSINLLGMFVGASLAGSLADRFGRRTIFQATLLLYSLLTGLSALAWSAASLMVLRFLTGLGLGGELPVASTLVAEFAPAHRRGWLVVLLESFWAWGSVLAALVGFLVIPRFGWQVAFLIGALPAFYVFVLRRTMPESVRYLVAKGRYREAEAIVEQVERSSKTSDGGGMTVDPGDSSPTRPAGSVAPSGRVGLGDLFAPAYLRRTIVLWAMWATMNFSYYGIFLWLPSQFVRKGLPIDQALLFNLIIAIAQVPGYFAAAWLVERWGRRPTLVVFLLACAVGAWVFGQVTMPEQILPQAVPSILLWGSVISFFNLGAWGVVYAYTPELYPTPLRGTGVGWAAAFGRVWGILAPLSIGLQLALFGNQANVFLAFVAIMVVGAAVVLGLGEETRGRTLEQIAPA
ncbi:MAG TPA: MFS transporter [Chloroflexota bacterium]